MIRILLADDYTIIRKGVRHILTQAYPNAQIDEIEDGEEWTERLEHNHWDMIISDLHMPDRGGLDTLSRLRQNFPTLLVLILTLYPKENYAVRALKAGAAGYLGKDAAPDELVLAVRQVLSGKRYITIPWTEN
ncbi:MAG TPA: response regulator transcription factor [Puia sp.]|jgi:DNA-binding NarL/FixJ family response regulator|nr:response regulator transcription factor [Puia sp.]